MENAYKRKKCPDSVKKSLIKSTVEIVARSGLQTLSLQAVAANAGVSKGGLLHHYENKCLLLDEVCKSLIDAFESQIRSYIECDPVNIGCYTRAYIRSLIDLEIDLETSNKNALWLLILNDDKARKTWNAWLDAMNMKYAESDCQPEMTLLRMAADGLWLSIICQTSIPNRDVVLQTLLQRSYDL